MPDGHKEATLPHDPNEAAAAADSGLRKLISVLHLDALARVTERREDKGSSRAKLHAIVWPALIGIIVPATSVLVTCVHDRGQLAVERERLASDRQIEMLRLALDDDMPEAIRVQILAGIVEVRTATATDDAEPQVDPVVSTIAATEQGRIETQLVALKEEREVVRKRVEHTEKRRKEAETQVVKAIEAGKPDPAAAKKLELLEAEHAEEASHLDVLQYRLGEGTKPIPIELAKKMMEPRPREPAVIGTAPVPGGP